MSNLIKAAQAVCDRWDSPNWKDQEHTAEFIKRLREAVEMAKADPDREPSSYGIFKGEVKLYEAKTYALAVDSLVDGEDWVIRPIYYGEVM